MSNVNYEKLKSIVNTLDNDLKHYETKNVKASGQRSRAHLLSIKKLCDTMRKEIMVSIKATPVKSRTKKDIVEDTVKDVVVENQE